MAGRPRKLVGHPGHFLMEWREDRELSPAQFAELMGIGLSTLYDLEAGKIDLSGKRAEKAAEVLNRGLKFRQVRATKGRIFDNKPLDLKDSIWVEADNVSPERREQAVKLLRVLNESK